MVVRMRKVLAIPGDGVVCFLAVIVYLWYSQWWLYREKNYKLQGAQYTNSISSFIYFQPRISPLLKWWSGWRNSLKWLTKYSKNCGVFYHVTRDEMAFLDPIFSD